MHRIAVIGSGPMALYTLKHLSMAKVPLDITIFEASPVAGVGMPYKPDLNADYMLCNAFSREIPPATRPLLDWLKDQPERELSEWELSPHDLTGRAFYPRVLIGEYLGEEFEALCDKAREKGHRVTVKTDCRVADIVAHDGKPLLQLENPADSRDLLFDDVIIASGHSWPKKPEVDGVRLTSPWPYTNIATLDAGDIGILGSSLSAIDVVVALGHAHGVFEESNDRVTWFPNDGSENLRVTMVSHLGIMPEGDFYYPFPYEPLAYLTEDAVQAEISKGPDRLLDRVFALLCLELDASDPDYLASFPPTARTIEGFGPCYFERRRELGGLAAVKRDLVKARESLRQKETIPHRYVLLRGHAIFDLVLRKLSESEYARFLEHLMPVFGDCYAAVPHLSLARVIAMYDAGALALLPTGEGSAFANGDEGSILVETEDGDIRLDIMIDARGQSPGKLSDLAFPSLVAQLSGDEEPLVGPFELRASGLDAGRVICLALPQLLERHPFSQGLVECHEISGIAVKRVLERVDMVLNEQEAAS
ncbi:FAD/NAD(P)-binding protein [Parasphingorhabdus sp.]|uniref:FAD/NAD(P)-binding protein n=1 Tax=Parasphingorhabdus sp. TaxID=2709688 RepID=UPI003A948F51